MTRTRAVLIGINAALAALIGLCLWLPLPSLPVSKEAGQSAAASDGALPSREIAMPSLTRPLFHSGSTAPEASSSSQAETSAPGIRLVGVLLSEDAKIAFIERPDMPLVRLGEGEEIDGWAVTAIEPRQLTLTSQGQAVIYPLDPPSEGE
ncbi:hypothetical protein AB4Y85_17515 [Microvirga sp. 2YAF29]|uniref:hypothetical protein n=1 Tax=Microvirga sp. 2YAF29 TaxID=3233031 RepID=UPI003F97080C